jgi:hypothetical protein
MSTVIFKARAVNGFNLYYHENKDVYRKIFNLPGDFELNPIIGGWIALTKFDLEYLGHEIIINNPDNLDLSHDLRFEYSEDQINDYIYRRLRS